MKISVCIPTYSRLNYLKKAVESIQAQTFGNIQICVSQDPKPDGPDIAIKSWCEIQALGIPSFSFNLNNTNLGLAGNWNQLVKQAQGEYIIIIGDDDLLAPTFLQELVDFINIESVDIVFSNQYFIDMADNILFETTQHLNNIYHRNRLTEGRIKHPIATVLKNTVPMSAALIKRDQLLMYPFDSSLNTPELDVFLKIAVNGGTFAYVNKQLAYYRIHAESETSSGLNVYKLLKNVISIDLPKEYEHLKFDFVSSKIIPSINNSLRHGDKEMAAYLLNSSYYPKSRFHFKIIQYILLICPNWLISILI